MQPENTTEQFVQLVISHQPRLRAFIRSLVPDRSAAADVLQETNLVLWRKSDEFELGTNFAAWMFRIARLQVMAARKSGRRHPMSFDDALIDRIADAAEQRSSLVEARREALGDCLAKLTEDQRAMIVARYTESKSPTEIAQSCDRPVGSIRQTLYRIRLALAECIDNTLAEEEI